jgi:hypothetical protein
LVAWDKFASLKLLGSLGIPNLKLINLTLQCRWDWLQKVYPSLRRGKVSTFSFPASAP